VRILIVSTLLLAGCADLESFDVGTCGNRVLDPDEDCDTFPDPLLGRDLRCGGASGGCRYVCSEGASCPFGWTCGTDLVCRHASSCYQDPGVATEIGDVDQILIADVTGDRRSDLIVRRRNDLEVFSGEPTGDFTSVHVSTIRDRRGDAAISDVDGDGIADIVVPIVSSSQPNARAGVYVARGGRSGLIPQSFADPNSSGWTPAHLVGGPTSFLLAFRELDPQGTEELAEVQLTWYEEACVANAVSVIGTPPVHRSKEVKVSSARTKNDRGTIVQAIAVAREDAIHLLAIEQRPPCGGPIVPFARLAMPEGFGPHEDQVFFAELDDDQDADLLVIAFDRELPRVLSAHARGGTLTTSTGLSIDERLREITAAGEGLPHVPCERDVLPILGVADLDRDGHSDFVTPHAILLQRSANGPLDRTIVRSDDTVWMDADIADFNRDGLLDVALMRGSTSERRCAVGSGILLLINQGSGRFVRREINSTTLSTSIRAADLDGDGLSDLALVQNQAEPVLSILWGESARPFSERTIVGVFPEIDGLAAHARATENSTAAGIADLALHTRLSVESFSITTVRGSADRVLGSPLLFDQPGEGGGRMTVAGGRILRRLSGVTRPYEDVAFVSPVNVRVLEAPALRFLSPWSRSTLAVPSDCLLLAAGPNVLAPELGPFTGIIAAVSKPEPLIRFVPPSSDPEVCATPALNEDLRIALLPLDPLFETVPVRTVLGRCASSRNVEIVDLDHDLRSDVLVTIGKAGPEAECGNEQLLALFGEPGDNALAFDEHKLELPDRLAGYSLQDAVTIHADRDPELEIAYLDLETGVGLVDVTKDRALVRREGAPVIAPSLNRRASMLGRLLSGDVDGDGLDDLVVFAGGRAVVHRALPQDVSCAR
jgi:hypothetical protein